MVYKRATYNYNKTRPRTNHILSEEHTTLTLLKYTFVAIIASLVIIYIIHLAWLNKTCLYEAFDAMDTVDTLNTQLSDTRKYTSYTDMILQETIANREKYIAELRSRDVAESYPWINIDGVWEQGTLIPNSIMDSNRGQEAGNRQRRWIPRERKYSDFSDILYIGNPLPS